jgi:2-dehydropantoate 2-reductase
LRPKELQFDNIIILGAGGIGSTYGALLSRDNNVMIVGNKAHVDAVNSNGLLISGEKKEIFRPRADTETREILDRTLILLTTKAQDSASAVEGIKPLLRRDTVILILQNGLGNEEAVRQAVGSKVEILRGITTLAAEFFKPGQIRFWGGTTIIEHHAAAEKIAETFNKSGLKTVVSKDINTEIWNKLIINSVINPLTAVFRVRDREICSRSLREVRHQIVSECVAVGKTQGIEFRPDLAEIIDKEIVNYTNFSSMCQDIMKGKKTEIDFLNGRIVELGRENHVSTTVNQTLVCMIKFLEERHGLPRED